LACHFTIANGSRGSSFTTSLGGDPNNSLAIIYINGASRLRTNVIHRACPGYGACSTGDHDPAMQAVNGSLAMSLGGVHTP